MFENISKGEFTSRNKFVELDGKILFTSWNPYLFGKTSDIINKNAEFVSFCFNLQQRYDISKLEEAVETLELVKSELYTIHSQYGDKQNALENSLALREIEQLLKEIKK